MLSHSANAAERNSPRQAAGCFANQKKEIIKNISQNHVKSSQVSENESGKDGTGRDGIYPAALNFDIKNHEKNLEKPTSKGNSVCPSADFSLPGERPEDRQYRQVYYAKTGDFGLQDPQKLRVCNHAADGAAKRPALLREVEEKASERMIKGYALVIKDNIDYKGLKASMPSKIELIDEFVAVMLDVLVTKEKTVRVGKEEKPRSLVTSQLMKIGYYDMEHVVSQFEDYPHRIVKKKQFMLTMLYNSKMELNAHVTNQFYSDM